MDKRIKKKWLKALRSGEYKQGYGEIVWPSNGNGKNRYCCLGVLSDIYDKEHPRRRSDACSKVCGGVPPRRVVKWAKLETADPTVLVNKKKRVGRTLVDLNDKDRYTFKQIANIIDKNL